jgi:hypothetical protein
MARFSGLVGFALTQRIRPGVTAEQIVERGPYFGDVKRASVSHSNDNSVNTELRVSNTVEIVADEFVNDNAFAIRFVVWAGVPWEVAEVTLEHPRLHLRLGGVYKGERAPETP